MTFMEKLCDHINGKSHPVHVKTNVSFSKSVGDQVYRILVSILFKQTLSCISYEQSRISLESHAYHNLVLSFCFSFQRTK